MIVACHRWVFGSLAKLIALKPGAILVTCLTISLLLCTGNVFTTFEDNFRSGYSESNSSTMHEHKAYRDFFNISVAPYTLGLVGECVDGGSMLRPEIFAEMKREVQRGLSKRVRSDDPMESRQTLADYLIFSDENHFTAIDEAINFPSDNVVAGYPYYIIFDRRLSMERVMYGWHNHSVNMLWYMMVFRPDTPEVVGRIKETELEWSQELEMRERGMLQLSLYGDEVVNHEIHRASINAIPYFFVGATAMILLVFFAVLRYKQNVCGTMFLTFWTVLCPLMAALMSLAVFTLYGVPINCMMLITPFLVLGVGVDNSFLMMHDWFQSKEIDGSGRLSVVLISVGPSVTLTSLTNIAAFLIGGALSPPDIRSFCLCSALALTFHWIFQFCVFAPALLRFHCCKYKLPAAVGQTAYSPAFISYSWFLRRRCVRLLALSVLLIYWSVSIYSALQMQENFSPRKTFDTESFLAKSLDRYERVFADHEMIHVIATELPKDVKSLHQVEATIHSLEYLCHNFATWMEDYEAEYEPIGNNIQKYFGELRSFVDSNPDLLRRVVFDVKDDESVVVKKVSFDICVQGIGNWRDRAIMVKDLRSRIPNGYSIYVYDSAVFDLILSTRRAMTKSVLTTLACLILLCVLFIPTVRATSMAVISVISIAIGVIGGLGAWGGDLDVIVMVNVVMAIGLTVDFTAHVSYRCFSGNPNESRLEKVARGIEMIAFPTALAALTTLLCALPLYFYRVYMYVFFAKTIILSAVLGYLHAVFVIPLFVSLF
uniref:SSD domain-containing protein n=1 Tax=Parascaris univalens TaxID=6257 RepID=A0A915A2W1_PARUN